jgi:glycosyltransferase involved in cell wall biosynthesis
LDRAPFSPDIARIGAPIVSVVIPAHNASATLNRTLESLLAQTFGDWEAIVVDDGSSDSTAQVANSIVSRDKRVRLVQQPAGGVSRARNTGIAEARGAWLLFLDADDVIVPQYLQKMLSAADRDPFCQAIICGYARVTPTGEKFDEYCPAGGDLFPRLAQTCVFAREATIGRPFAGASKFRDRFCQPKTRPHDADFQTFHLPILMYHRVAPSGAQATARWRVTPEAFQQQLKYLYDAGYYSVTFKDWHATAQFKKPLPGRAIILTIDDGYMDVFDFAAPLLRKYGSSAYVFFVADRIGQTNLWDERFGETLPLMGWRQIRKLQEAGIRFGSHTCTHPMLTSLSNAHVVREAARSVATLTEGLGQPVTSFAYPFGDHDPAIARLLGACGLNYCVTCRSALAECTDPLTMLPRLEVCGDAPLKDLVAKLSVP